MKREAIFSKEAPQPIGPYSQAIRWGTMVFAAGQTGTDPKTGNLVDGVQAQTRQVLTNLNAVLQAAGTDLSHALKTTVFLADMNDFGAMNAIYGEYFPSAPPARTTVAAKALPKGALVEIEVIAAIEE
jgi:2-iminobutanoate/2-iminopropanoate deaminase